VRRRRLLAALCAATGSAGCLSAPSATTPTPTATPARLAARGEPADICDRGLDPTENIEAVVEPAFADDWLADDSLVVGVARAGRARAYPVSTLTYVEAVNDRFPGDEPLLVTYCPVCDSGLVAERRVAGEPTRFGVTGQVWEPPQGRSIAADPVDGDAVARNGNLVLYDAATGSYWSQLLARAICGPRRGDVLTVVPARTATWGAWRRAHPGTDVLLPPPDSTAENPPYPGSTPSDEACGCARTGSPDSPGRGPR
jgi:hypothetical protein